MGYLAKRLNILLERVEWVAAEFKKASERVIRENRRIQKVLGDNVGS